MLKDLAVGDMVTVRRIDRLARSTFDLFAVIKAIADGRDCPLRHERVSGRNLAAFAPRDAMLLR